MNKIGFSHGVLYKVLDVNTKKNIQFLSDRCNAIEINFHHAKGDEFSRIQHITPYIRDFSYISLHMPCDIRYGNNEETRTLLSKARNYYTGIDAQLAVIHPDLIDDREVFDDFVGINWAVENMDDRKERFKDVNDLNDFFLDHSAWGLVLDLGHCNANDKSMNLASDLISNFRGKIKEIHLSGYETFHDPLFRTRQTEIINYCKKLDVPIIIESTFELMDSIVGVKKELDYITENLKEQKS